MTTAKARVRAQRLEARRLELRREAEAADTLRPETIEAMARSIFGPGVTIEWRTGEVEEE